MNYKNTLDTLYKINNSLRKENGTYIASLGEFYANFCWFRDTFYQSLPTLKTSSEQFVQTYHTFLDFLKKYEYKMDYLISNPKDYNNHTVLHPRFYTNLDEITDNWGNQQMDAFALMLFGISIGIKHDLNVIRDDSDRFIIEKCIYMYETLEYCKLKGNDCWEEYEEVHSHALGAIIKAITELGKYNFKYDKDKLELAKIELDKLLPNESITKKFDLAQLQLIYPLNVVNEEQKKQILNNIETNLVRNNGVIRYIGDQYYNIASEYSFHSHRSMYLKTVKDQFIGNELEWSFGFAYLSIIYKKEGEFDKAKYYLDKILNTAGENLMIPEGYYSKTNIKNENTPLGWSVALTILAIEELYNL